MPISLAAAFAGALGAACGSFFNVLAYRLPNGQSLVHPRSHCPHCQAAIRPYHNVPVLGWLMLRGRCRDCRAPISARYPVVESLSAALAVAVVLAERPLWRVLLGLALVAVLVPVAMIDLDHRIIPNKITLPAAVAALVIGALAHPSGVPEQLIAGAAACGFLGIFALLYPRGMGMGDAKLAGVLGLYLGRSVGSALLVALVAGTLVGLAVMGRLGVQAGRKTAVPFGPFLALGGLVAIFAGPALIHWYLHTRV